MLLKYSTSTYTIPKGYLFIHSFMQLQCPLARRKLSLSRKPEGNVKYTFTSQDKKKRKNFETKLSKYVKNNEMQDYKITN